MKDISQNIDNIRITEVTSNILLEQFEEFIKLKNYNSSIHFPKENVDKFNRKKMMELVEYLKEFKAIVFGAYEEMKLIGFIWGYPRIFFNERRIFVNCLVVEKKHEKKGIGKKLMNALEDFAVKNKYDAIDLMVAPFNENAVGFYNHLGFESERIQMYKKIGEKK